MCQLVALTARPATQPVETKFGGNFCVFPLASSGQDTECLGTMQRVHGNEPPGQSAFEATSKVSHENRVRDSELTKATAHRERV